MKTAANIALLINPEFYYPVSYTIRQDGVRVHEKTKLQGKELTEPQIVELINSGYFAQFSQQKSDSVDADIEQEIENIIKDNINIAFKGEGRVVFDYKVCASLLARRFAGSKVKPVNDGWIPIEKELPEEGKKVYVYAKGWCDDDMTEAFYKDGKWYDNESHWDNINDENYHYEIEDCGKSLVTNWQPLPKSPR